MGTSLRAPHRATVLRALCACSIHRGARESALALLALRAADERRARLTGSAVCLSYALLNHQRFNSSTSFGLSSTHLVHIPQFPQTILG